MKENLVYLWAIVPPLLAWCSNALMRRRRGASAFAGWTVGAAFGLVAVFVQQFLVSQGGLLARLPVCDAFVIVAAFWFGARAGGLAAGIVFAERLASSFFVPSVGVQSAFASAMVGLFAVAIARYLFRGERPALVPAAILSAMAEILHLAVLFIFGTHSAPGQLDLIIAFVRTAPVICFLSSAVASVALWSWRGWRRNFLSAATGVAAFYALSLAGTVKVGLDSAERKTEALLEYAEADLRNTVDEAVDSMLGHVGRAIVKHLGAARPETLENMRKLSRQYDLDELNIVDRRGRVIGSNLEECLNADMTANPETAGKFMVLTNGVTEVYSQKFRRGADNPDMVCKYLGVAFPRGEGYIQLGYDERRLARNFRTSFGGFLATWQIGETGFYICADKAYSIVATPIPGHPEAFDKNLTKLGIDIFGIPHTDGGETFVQTVFGERCYCRHFIYARHRMFSVVPAIEFYGSAMQFVFAAVAILFVVFAVFGYAIGHMVSQNRRIAELRALEDARREKDLKMAKNIQASALPAVFPPFPNETRIDLFAQMVTAKEVGGDFYDLYRLDPDHVVLVMADVSGKGVPAAMFMMRAKAILKSCETAMPDLAAAVAEANARLDEGNDAMMFVTAWTCVIDLRTGAVSYVNAGHNPPYVRHADGSVEKLDRLSGPPLATVPSVRYRNHSTTLRPGDMLVLYTDGVTEAMNAAQQLFGEPRLEETMALARGTDARGTCAAILSSVGAFAAGAPQADDITVLSFLYQGASANGPVESNETMPRI